jgi:hypothetical protein
MNDGMDKQRAERLLRSLDEGAPVRDPLTPLLSALQPPPARGELPGEAAALHAFQQAQQFPAERPAEIRSWRRFAGRFARMSTTRLIIAGLAATSIGGGSLALASGSVKIPAHISRPGHGHGHRHPAVSPDPSGHLRPPARTGTPSPHPLPTKPAGPLPSHRTARAPGHHPSQKPVRPEPTASATPTMTWKMH